MRSNGLQGTVNAPFHPPLWDSKVVEIFVYRIRVKEPNGYWAAPQPNPTMRALASSFRLATTLGESSMWSKTCEHKSR